MPIISKGEGEPGASQDTPPPPSAFMPPPPPPQKKALGGLFLRDGVVAFFWGGVLLNCVELLTQHVPPIHTALLPHCVACAAMHPCSATAALQSVQWRSGSLLR